VCAARSVSVRYCHKTELFENKGQTEMFGPKVEEAAENCSILYLPHVAQGESRVRNLEIR
jgi:hypothetical protein